MKTNNKNNPLLMSAVRVMTRDYGKFFISFFGVMTALYLVGFIVNFSGGSMKIGGIEGVYFIACFVAGLASFKEDYFFMAQNQVPKSTMTKAFIIEGFLFGLATSFAVNAFAHLTQWISSALNYDIPRFIDLIPKIAENGGLLEFGRTFVILLSLYVAIYFIGLMLGTINYRLNWLGRVIFWVPFGFLMLNGFIGTLQYYLDDIDPEKLEVLSVTLAKPFIYALEWLMQSLGNFVITCAVVTVFCIVVGALTFRGAEVKYSNKT
ncbi:MAG: hypothetical protein ACOX36_02640 [Saccharofermentanales bacterium]|jgi:hypothetical protein|nr:hypothetical protein [Clostridiaceae bacterium]